MLTNEETEMIRYLKLESTWVLLNLAGANSDHIDQLVQMSENRFLEIVNSIL